MLPDASSAASVRGRRRARNLPKPVWHAACDRPRAAVGYFVRTIAIVIGEVGVEPPSVSVKFAVCPAATPKRV